MADWRVIGNELAQHSRQKKAGGRTTSYVVHQKGTIYCNHALPRPFISAFFLNLVLRPFQDYFSSYETGQSVGGRKRENPEKNTWHTRLSHMWPERGS